MFPYGVCAAGRREVACCRDCREAGLCESWFTSWTPKASASGILLIQEANLVRLPDEMLKTVCFLCVKQTAHGQDSFQFGGTGFFVTVPSLAHPNDIYYMYLVTARHNIEKAEATGCPLLVRLNLTGGGVGFVEIRAPWYFHENPAVDVAVIPWDQPLERDEQGIPRTQHGVFDLKSFPAQIFVSNEVLKNVAVGIGDELMFVGLFSQRYGSTMNHPVVRSGVLSAMPGEPLLDDSGYSYHAYLAELRSLGGLSGSPVLVGIDPIRPGAFGVRSAPPELHSVFYLLGLIRGHWDLKKRQTTVDYADAELEQVNMGMAIVTPIQDLIQILMGEELMKLRKKQDADFVRKPPPPMDSDSPE